METTSAATYARVLVVDDEALVRDMFERALSRAGYIVDEATDGFEAIGAARQRRPQVIVLDGDLPVLDGFEACALLRRQPDTAAIPIIFVTAMAGTEYRDKALAAGADVFLTKPVAPDDLVAHVRAVLV